MPLDAGRRLGAFEILEPVGAGGMGEVYRAKDTRLDRIVALKVLPSALADNEALRERLAREARAISGLTHPHICTLYDVGRDEGIDYLVMEYLEGETLAERLRKGPLPLEQALRCAVEIAEALDAAHRRGVVHRDLKPGNVMLTKTGAKLLDFGLARLMETGKPPSEASASSLTTQEQPLTEKGTLLGTYPYMAPEQAEGKETDGRADIFAFGAMLHEMVTGSRAFEGESRASLIAAILEREPPPVSTLQPLSPLGLDHVVATCLAKDPDDRWQSARDVASELRWIQEAGSQAGWPAPVVRRRKTRERSGWILATLLLAVATLAGTWAWKDARQPTPPIVRSSVLPPEGARFDFGRTAPALSPDGSRLAFTAAGDDGTRRLWVRPLSALTGQPLAGTEGAESPFWSPDGGALGFYSNGKLRTIDTSGGPPRALCDASWGGGGTWGPDDTILFSKDMGSVIHKVSASGGTSVPVTALDPSRNEYGHRYPQFLPDGRHFLFLVQSPDDTPGTEQGMAVFVAALGSPEKRPIVETPSSARYASSGHLLFMRARTLVAQAFDLQTLELSGDAIPVADHVRHAWRWQAMFSVSDNGRLVYQGGPAAEEWRLVWLDREGRELGTVGGPADYSQPRLSHDQTRVAVSIRDSEDGQDDLWILDASSGTSTRLTFDPAHDYAPVWSADDETIYFASDRSGRGDVYSKPSAGAGTAERVYGGEGIDALVSIAPDGGTAWLHSWDPSAQPPWDILRLDLHSGEAEPFPGTSAARLWPALSPDGRRLLYTARESGPNEVYVRSLADGGGRWQVSAAGGNYGRWTRDGREIVYRARDRTLMAVEVNLEPSFSTGAPEPLFKPRARDLPMPQWDVTPDGERFLVIRAAEEDVDEPLTLVQNWTSELKR